jgi:DNA helicase-2/ATP-dependent DNA helicase PcrA
LVTTFSRKAADELHRRLWMLGVADTISAGTFHHTALALLRQHRLDRGLAAPTVLGDRRSVLRRLLATTSGHTGADAGDRGAVVAQLDTEIGWAKARLVTPDAYPDAARDAGRHTTLPTATIADLFQRYEERKGRDQVDLDDLLVAAGDLIEDDPAFAELVRWRFRHLFVDEMQDVNPSQFRLLCLLTGAQPDLFVVGDPNQSVYGWNGADPGLLDRLPDRWPETRVIRLDENHRCTPEIVRVATAALGADAGASQPISTRASGPVPQVAAHATDADEAAWVAHQAWLAHRPGRRWSHQAVLARTNAQLATVRDALEGARIPWQMAGGELAPASDVTRTGGGEDSRAEPPADGVLLTTFHRAKGLQWPTVFVIGLADGLAPIGWATTAAALAEERRLLYVALTRAEDELYCSWALYRDAQLAGSGRAARRPSRWLAAVEEVCAELTRQAAPPDPASVASRVAELRALLGSEEPPPR